MNGILESLKASAKPTTGTVDRRSHMMPCTLTLTCLSLVDLLWVEDYRLKVFVASIPFGVHLTQNTRKHKPMPSFQKYWKYWLGLRLHFPSQSITSIRGAGSGSICSLSFSTRFFFLPIKIIGRMPIPRLSSLLPELMKLFKIGKNPAVNSTLGPPLLFYLRS